MSENTSSKPEANGEQKEIQVLAITKQFLEFTFEKHVKSFSVKMGTNPGDNYMSVMHAVEVTFTDNSTPHHYLVKAYPTDVGRREFLNQMNIFQKEYFMYNDYFPLLQKMVVDSGADVETVGLKLPPFHGGNVAVAPSEKYRNTEWANENFIIMTDLRTQNYTMADRLAGLDLEHTKLVLKEQAKMHALSWALKEKSGLDYLSSKYPSFVDNVITNDKIMQQFKGLMDSLVASTLNILEEAIGADHPAFKGLKTIFEKDTEGMIKKFFQPHGTPENEFEEMLRIKPDNDGDHFKGPWLTGTHGDCWMNNMLFRYDNSQETPKLLDLIFVDFQVFREVCPTIDMAYFLFSSVRAPVRVSHLNEILKAYYEAFIFYCKELKVKPFPGFTLEALQRRFKRSEVFGLLMALPLLTFVLKPKEEAVDLEKSDSKDISEVFGSVMTNNEKNTKYRDEITATVLDLYGKGVI